VPPCLPDPVWEADGDVGLLVDDVNLYSGTFEKQCMVSMTHRTPKTTTTIESSLADLFSSVQEHPSRLVDGLEPFYSTTAGAAYLGDSCETLKAMPDGSVNLVFTSPPYALHFKKEYGNVSKADYVEWFLRFAREIFRVLSDDGSFVLNIGGSWNPGVPTRSLYHYKLMIALVEELGFHLAQECYWYNPAKMPVPAEWVTVRRIRIKDSVEHVWWLSKTAHPKADNRKVLRPYSADMLRLARKGVRTTVRPSGHNINSSFDKIESGGSIPSNVLQDQLADEMLVAGNNAANDPYTKRCKESGMKIHPARFPAALPEFFIKLLTNEGDLVVDPFSGSNTAGAVAERLGRQWIAMELLEEYLEASKFRFAE
jgi:DNA modification methylase